jgi:PAS domain S-box-containing protein
MTAQLPDPVSRLVDAANRHDTNAFLACFTAEASTSPPRIRTRWPSPLAGSPAPDRGRVILPHAGARTGYELAQFFDFSRDLFCIAGFDGYYKLVNASFERVLGYSREELMSRPFMEIVHPDDVERAHDVLAVLATGEDVVGFESRLICADGSARRFEWNTRTMPHLGVVYGIARD